MNDKPRKPRLTSKVMKSLSMASGYIAADLHAIEDRKDTHDQLVQAIEYIDPLARWYHAKGRKVTK
jgi:hypothetical protein